MHIAVVHFNDGRLRARSINSTVKYRKKAVTDYPRRGAVGLYNFKWRH